MDLLDHPSLHGVLPFIFQPCKVNPETLIEERIGKTIVKIALFDCTFYNSSWMSDELIGDSALVPDVDLCMEEPRVFNTEQEAIAFVRDWWMNAKCGDYEFFIKKASS